jgi:hypothetical protein
VCSYEQISDSSLSDRNDNVVETQSTISSSNLALNLDAANTTSYPGTGTTWFDLSGNARNGTLVNGPTYNTEGFFSFDASNDNVSLGTFFNFPVFTISIWCYPGTTQNQYADIFDNNHAGSQNFVLQQNNTTTNQYSFSIAGSPASRGSPVFNLTALQWVNLTFTHNSSAQIGYRNGVQFYSTLGNTPTYISPNLYLARWGGGTRYWNGRISSFIVYDRVLTPEEVLNNFEVLRVRHGI